MQLENLLSIGADFSHLFALLLFKLGLTRSCGDVSAKTQLLLGVAFVIRYIRVFDRAPVLWSTTAFQLTVIDGTLLTLFLIFVSFRKPHLSQLDTFPSELLVFVAAVLSVTLHSSCDAAASDCLQLFSTFLETLALLPQMYLLIRKGQMERITYVYLKALALNRGLHISNFTISGKYDVVIASASLLQAFIFFVFFIYVEVEGLQLGDSFPTKTTAPPEDKDKQQLVSTVQIEKLGIEQKEQLLLQTA